ncbi:hypothetical protein DOTSEDRAFT_50899 [Dothistroma septosporum NZE10]|uniref:Uncharacterized protein n=1 Tax=Dothistroma septosporum (strain NZE10 / CBS 128990) TaxID=675120 RepID=N1PYN1_DOTSN|nr:hypothetical protein DOTSEDRAFT_50899 [Dothistroma septosporum NZE10]
MAVNPDARVIALAVSVVRSKPEELSVGEYIRLLKQHVAKGRRDRTISSQHRHLDRSSYWRSEAERMKAQVKAWESHAINLQKQLDVSRVKLDASRPSSPIKKRKKFDEDTIPVPRLPKKSKTNAAAPFSSSAALRPPEDDEFSQAGDIGSILLHSVYYIHDMIKANFKTEPLELAYHVQKASAALPPLVMPRFKGSTPSDQNDSRAVLNVANRTVVSILIGFNRLGHVPQGNTVQGRMTYAIVQMFKDLLAVLEQLSSAEAGCGQSSGSASSPQKPTDKSRAKAKPKTTKVTEASLLSMYTSFLCGLIDLLDSKLEANRALFEGISFCVLDRLGSRLFTTVFGHTRGATISEEIMQSRETGDEIEDADSPPLTETQLYQTRIEAPYLIHLLKKVMSAAPAYLGSTSSNNSGKANSSKAAPKRNLSMAAKECLQRTLINGIFGVEASDEENPFAEFLSMPPAGQDVPMPKGKEADVQEWFKEEVWRVLGWDILAYGKF